MCNGWCGSGGSDGNNDDCSNGGSGEDSRVVVVLAHGVNSASGNTANGNDIQFIAVKMINFISRLPKDSKVMHNPRTVYLLVTAK